MYIRGRFTFIAADRGGQTILPFGGAPKTRVHYCLERLGLSARCSRGASRIIGCAVRSVVRALRSIGVLYLYSETKPMLAIRIPQSIEKRLEKLARRTGRTKTYYVREAILEHLEDLEDLYLAERALERSRSGEERTIPLKDAMKRHGVQRRAR